MAWARSPSGDDPWLALSVETDLQWNALLKLLDRPEWELRADLTSSDRRYMASEEIDVALAAWAARKDVCAAAEVLVQAGVPAAPARDPRRMLEHPQLRARGFHEITDHPVVGQLLTPSMPFRSAKVRRWLRRAAPTLGQHNHEVYVTELGLSEAHFAELAADRIIGTRPIGL